MPAHDDPVQPFNAAAERYCTLIERQPWPAEEQLLLQLAESLAELYATALRLATPLSESSDLPETRLSNEQWRDRFFPFAAALAQTRPLFEDKDTDYGVEYGFLSDDLGDVYRDVKEGLLLQADGVGSADVVWHWRFTFWGHWGEHAANALRIVTKLLSYVGGVPFEPASTRR